MVKKTKGYKRLESLRNIVLDVLASLHLQAASCELSKASVGLLPLTFCWARPGGASRGLEDGRNEVCVFLSGFLLTELNQRLCFFPRPWFLKALCYRCRSPCSLFLQVTEEAMSSSTNHQNRMIPGRITSRVDFFYLCPMLHKLFCHPPLVTISRSSICSC